MGDVFSTRCNIRNAYQNFRLKTNSGCGLAEQVDGQAASERCVAAVSEGASVHRLCGPLCSAAKCPQAVGLIILAVNLLGRQAGQSPSPMLRLRMSGPLSVPLHVPSLLEHR